ncbi:LysR family transcriptional regulator [Salimicrobium salexigens]|uniref:DNA-binding transcriptional regulator, LysR family n=1 Tax=Salimicrobium salexigens TaxID=908941 RepID=A0ABY1KKY2_9BACI|nr:LysR family transcriptional regulator [Salimicrobium salexigens]SIS46749.1 DNA-binding transcriptional regulator, LysR family [Salimicrobium salexigens]
MDIRHLTYFIEVTRFESFTRAAEHLYVTQPTISKMIKNLETELGVELFDRSRKQLVLTDAGRAIYDKAKTIVKASENLQTELDDLIGLQKGHIRIGLPPILDAELFIGILGEFHQVHPRITFELIENGTKKIEEDILNEHLDAGIAVLPPEEEEFDTFSFIKEELRAVLPASHPLAGRRRIDLKELENDDFITFNRDFALYERIHDACLSAGFVPKTISETSQWDFIGKMITSGLGISILPYSVANLLKEDLRLVKIRNPSLEWNVGLIWRKNHYLSYATREWLRFTQERLIENSS